MLFSLNVLLAYERGWIGTCSILQRRVHWEALGAAGSVADALRVCGRGHLRVSCTFLSSAGIAIFRGHFSRPVLRDYFLRRLQRDPARPARPAPSTATVAGSGTGALAP